MAGTREPLKTHLQLSASQFTTYRNLRAAIETYVSARHTWSSTTTTGGGSSSGNNQFGTCNDMGVGYVGKGGKQGKGGKGKFGKDPKGSGKGKKGKDKGKGKGGWNQPPVAGTPNGAPYDGTGAVKRGKTKKACVCACLSLQVCIIGMRSMVCFYACMAVAIWLSVGLRALQGRIGLQFTASFAGCTACFGSVGSDICIRSSDP